MAYPLNKHTKSKYIASGFQSYQRLQPEKFYYMPEITDELSNTWTIKVCDPLDLANPLESFTDFPIYAGYRVFLSETFFEVKSYSILIFNTSNELIFDRAISSLEYGLSELAFINSADILPTSVPKKPTNLTLTVIAYNQINLSWTDASTDESSFRIERSLDGTSWSTVATVSENVTSYNNTGLSASTTYQYRVVAYNAIGDSTPSAKKSATTTAAPLNAPSNLVAIASGTNITLSWTDNSDNETGFKLERSLSGVNSWTQIAVISANTTFYGDTGLSPGTAYDYRIRSYTASSNSSYSSTATATTLALPNAPLYLATNTLSSTEITISWTDDSNNETGFKIERSPNNSTWTQIATVSANETMYSDTGLTPQTTYYYRVRAYNAAGNSSYSNTDSGYTFQAPPAAPIDFDIVVLSTSSVKLTWTDVATDETGFVIDRSTDGGLTWYSREVKTPNLNQFTDTGLSLGTYSYRVFARNPGGDSEATKTIEVTLTI